MAIHRPVRLWRSRPAQGEQLSLAVEAVKRGDTHGLLQSGDGLGFSAGQVETFTAGAEGADLLRFSLL